MLLPEKYREFAKFLVVGGTTWIIDTGTFFLLKHTVLPEKVLTAKIIAILIAMIVNYVLNREWSFRTAAAVSGTTRRCCSSC